ncbi:unnamed protein product [Durusdinium trenchii]|uniref:Uncharacterized protein n=1 Tax=Durusdinium trenchii TaxID=1381693 RepID=A0ABP0MJK0_9DINO
MSHQDPSEALSSQRFAVLAPGVNSASSGSSLPAHRAAPQVGPRSTPPSSESLPLSRRSSRGVQLDPLETTPKVRATSEDFDVAGIRAPSMGSGFRGVRR